MFLTLTTQEKKIRINFNFVEVYFVCPHHKDEIYKTKIEMKGFNSNSSGRYFVSETPEEIDKMLMQFNAVMNNPFLQSKTKFE